MINFTKKKKLIFLIIFTLISIFFITRFGSGWNTLFNDPILDIIFSIFGLIMMSFAIGSIGVFCLDKILFPLVNLFTKKNSSSNSRQKNLIEDVFVFFGVLNAFLDLILGIIKSVFFQILVAVIIIISIIKFVDATWLKWLLLIMFGGAFYYSVKEDIASYVQKETMKAIKKREKQKTEIAKGTYKGDSFFKIPTKKEAIRNWAKAIFWLGLFLIMLKIL